MSCNIEEQKLQILIDFLIKKTNFFIFENELILSTYLFHITAYIHVLYNTIIFVIKMNLKKYR